MRSRCTSRACARSSSRPACGSAPCAAWAISWKRGRMASLRFRLVGWLLPPLVAVGVVAAGGAYAFLARRLTDAYDLDLGDIARALVPYVRMREQKLSLEIPQLAHPLPPPHRTHQ